MADQTYSEKRYAAFRSTYRGGHAPSPPGEFAIGPRWTRSDSPQYPQGSELWRVPWSAPGPHRSFLKRVGFDCYRVDWWEPYGGIVSGSYGQTTLSGIIVPHFVLAFGELSPWLFLFARKLRMKRRARLGLCSQCGYDLRCGHDRCPECGRPVGANARNT